MKRKPLEQDGANEARLSEFLLEVGQGDLEDEELIGQ